MRNNEMKMRRNVNCALQTMRGVDKETAKQVATMAIKSQSKRYNIPVTDANVSIMADDILSESENAGTSVSF